ncbi:hypothetical protein CDD80_73 [Ophiocordyceps camponoti-rufipedis]|uniref:Uncharacterized protein n=1 Tax=Ophiocordyceps camponoti-rufipedis TaxID=2004952 RepID=A0A2C5ZFK7_9HYPO|nr:hypothetical protein CDD80_73 [Ophiocordyceps camponoti-rufipedis]
MDNPDAEGLDLDPLSDDEGDIIANLDQLPLTIRNARLQENYRTIKDLLDRSISKRRELEKNIKKKDDQIRKQNKKIEDIKQKKITRQHTELLWPRILRMWLNSGPDDERNLINLKYPKLKINSYNDIYKLSCLEGNMSISALLAPLLVNKNWHFWGSHCFYGNNSFAFSSIGEFGRLESLTIWVRESEWHRRRSHEETKRQRNLPSWRRSQQPRQHDPGAFVGYMTRLTERQPNKRSNRALRCLQGIDYVYCLRGLRSIKVFDYCRVPMRVAIRDETFLDDLRNCVTRGKEESDFLQSKLRNLPPLISEWRPTEEVWKCLEELQCQVAALDNGDEDDDTDSDGEATYIDSSSDASEDESDDEQGADDESGRPDNGVEKSNRLGSGSSEVIDLTLDDDDDAGSPSGEETSLFVDDSKDAIRSPPISIKEESSSSSNSSGGSPDNVREESSLFVPGNDPPRASSSENRSLDRRRDESKFSFSNGSDLQRSFRSMEIGSSRLSFSDESRTSDRTERGESSVSATNRSDAQRFSNSMDCDKSPSPEYSDDSQSSDSPSIIDLTGDDDDEGSRGSSLSAKRSNDDESHEGRLKRQRSE